MSTYSTNPEPPRSMELALAATHIAQARLHFARAGTTTARALGDRLDQIIIEIDRLTKGNTANKGTPGDQA